MNRVIAPQINSFGTLYFPDVCTTVLSNGITLHTISGGDSEVNRITITLPGGDAESPAPGVSSIALAMLLEGTKSHSGDEIANILEYNGAWTNTAVSTHHSSLTLYSLNDRLESVIGILREIITEPSFPSDTLTMVKKRRSAKIEINREKITYHSGIAIKKMMYGSDQPLAYVETPESLENVTAEILRDFHFSRLDTRNIHIFLSGKLSNKIIKLVISTFSEINTHASFPIKRIIFPEFIASQTVTINRPESLQSSIVITIPAIGRMDSDFVPLRAAVTTLGGYFGSRLMTNIREEKGLTYGISASLLGYKDKSFIYIATQTDCSKSNIVMQEVFNEIERMKDENTYTTDEIARIRQFQLSNLASALDSPFTIMDFYQTRILAATPPDYFKDQQTTALNLSPGLLASMAKKYFKTSLTCTAIAGAINECH